MSMEARGAHADADVRLSEELGAAPRVTVPGLLVACALLVPKGPNFQIINYYRIFWTDLM